MTFQYTHQLVSDLPTPRKQVLLLTCMDLRLLDNTVAFMNEYNLANRYDQLAFAGAALGVMRLASPSLKKGGPDSSWKSVFFHHLQVAINDLHRDIRDVFIMEHRDCGAYEKFHPTHRKPYSNEPKDQKREERHHREQAFALAKAIDKFCIKQVRTAKKWAKEVKGQADYGEAKRREKAWGSISAHCFLMDLRGDVKHLSR